ncbi:MAG: hypothetical protein AABZ31_12670 [Bdellovibrionota bacterium]
MNTIIRLTLIHLLVLCFATVGWSAPRKKAKSKTKVTRVITVTKNASVHKKVKSRKIASKKAIAKKPKKMSEKDRKALARRQVEHARLVASLRKEQNQTPVFKANSEVTIRDYGFEPTPISSEEKAVMTASITAEELKLDTPSNAPYVDDTAVYIEAADEDLGFED